MTSTMFTEMHTFVDLYNTLISFNGDVDQFGELLSIAPKGKDIQESCLRLFAKLECIIALADYTACTGNFNLSNFEKITKIDDIFYHARNKLIYLKDSGDASDLTMISHNGQQVLAFTSKNLNRKHIGVKSLDIEPIVWNGKDLDMGLRLGICIRSRTQFNVNRSYLSSIKNIKEYLINAIILDHSDLINAFTVFHDKFTQSFDDLMKSNISAKATYRPHQRYTIDKTHEMIKGCVDNYVNVLWGHIARSGKTYMMRGLIEKLAPDGNIMIITTAPNETIVQYKKVMSDLKAIGYNLITQKEDIDKMQGSNVIIMSKQMLGHCVNVDLEIPNVKLLFTDKAHHGGTTEIASEIMSRYHNCHKVFVTATYGKVFDKYAIDHVFKWDLEDIELCKQHKFDLVNFKYEGFDQYIDEDVNVYDQYPKLNLIGLDLDNTYRVNINKSDEVWELDTLFNITNGSLKNETLVRSLFVHTLNTIVKLDKDNESIGQRSILHSDTPSVIMCFLPSKHISDISKCVGEIIQSIDIDDVFEIICCNTIDSQDDVRKRINESVNSAVNRGRKTVIALTGTQGHLGITIPSCDLVLLMNHSRSMDFVYQSMFRCMTEADAKKYGYVIDFDIDRVLTTVCEYGKHVAGTSLSNRKAIGRIVDNEIFNVRFSEDMDCYDKHKMLDNIMKRYNGLANTRIDSYLRQIGSYDVKLTEEQLNRLGKFILRSTAKSTTIHDDNMENDTMKLDKTIDDATRDGEQGATMRVVSKEDKMNYMNTLKHLIPVISIITISEPYINTFIGMMECIKVDSWLYSIVQSQFQTWWGSTMSDIQYDTISNLFKELGLEDNDNVSDTVSSIKSAFVEMRDNHIGLGKAIDKYLVPAKEEKVKNAEVSTPWYLRKEMLDLFPPEFWTKAHKVYEPCCGKGGFVVDIVDRFLKGGLTLKVILEECIYFADINPLNIFCTILLIDPNREYKLNYYCGDSLNYDWNIEFDAVIGNPPYNDGSKNKGANHCIWTSFVLKALSNDPIDRSASSLNKWLAPCGYLLYVHPSGWRQFGHPLYKLLCDRQLIYLEIHNSDDGRRVFKCSTRYDWYLLQNKPRYTLTTIKGEDGIIETIDLYEWEFIPNMMFSVIKNLLATSVDTRCEFEYSRSAYGTERKWVSKCITDEFSNPVVYSINKKNEITLRFSNTRERGHFGRSKFIFSNGAGYCKDIDGKYGLTEWAYCFYCTEDTMSTLEKIFVSDRFKRVCLAIKLTSDTYNKKILPLFRYDFYNYI